MTQLRSFHHIKEDMLTDANNLANAISVSYIYDERHKVDGLMQDSFSIF